MSQEVVQWLNEIKALKQDVTDLQQALIDSNASVNRWRQLYETEAQQRRQDAEKWQTKIDQLQADMAQLQQQLQQNASTSGLQQAHDQLAQALAEEKRRHEQTRRDLTTALSDTMDMLLPGQQRLPDVIE